MERLILLDTHVVLWLIENKARLSRVASRALRAASHKLLADISLREIAALASAGRIELDREVGDWLERAAIRRTS